MLRGSAGAWHGWIGIAGACRGAQLSLRLPGRLYSAKTFCERYKRSIRCASKRARGDCEGSSTSRNGVGGRRGPLLCRKARPGAGGNSQLAGFELCASDKRPGPRNECEMTFSSEIDKLHQDAHEIFRRALDACSIEAAFDRHLRFEGDTLVRIVSPLLPPSRIELK